MTAAVEASPKSEIRDDGRRAFLPPPSENDYAAVMAFSESPESRTAAVTTSLETSEAPYGRSSSPSANLAGPYTASVIALRTPFGHLRRPIRLVEKRNRFRARPEQPG